jgi:excisionase family DNA binding protein
MTRDDAARHSRPSQIFAPFTEDSADRLRTLLTVREVAVYLRVSTATVYELCARGELPHIRVLNAIRVAPSDLGALASQRLT